MAGEGEGCCESDIWRLELDPPPYPSSCHRPAFLAGITLDLLERTTLAGATMG